MEKETLRVLFLGADSPEVSGLVAVLDRATRPWMELHWEAEVTDAVERVAEEHFDVLLLGADLAPDCPAILDRLRIPAPRLPVIALTWTAEDSVGLDAVSAGAADHLHMTELANGSAPRAILLAVERARATQVSDRYEVLLQGARDALWHWDVRSDRVRFSQRWAEMIGLPDGRVETTADAWFERVHPNDVARLRERISEHLAEQSDVCEAEYRVRHADGTYRWVSCRGVARRDSSGAFLFAGSHSDVHGFKSGAAQIAELYRDPLTGLPSRALFHERLGQAVTRLRVDPRDQFAVLVLDLDRFQKVNDGLGHAAGDQLLTEVTARLRSCLNEGDTLTRLGSDKFAILRETLQRPVEAVRTAELILKALGPAIQIEGEEVFPSAGMGLVLGAEGYRTAEDVMSDAYSAMHRAKATGGAARYEIFDPAEHARNLERLRLEADLRRAIERNELCLHYQPIVSVATGRIRAFEALVRWIHPERGLVSPGQFVPLAEETGLISSLGSWVLDEACSTSRRWNERYANGDAIGVSVNLSGRQFADPDLAGEIEQTIDRHELDPSGLKLEITESVLMENSSRNTDQLERLRGLGLELMIDDFGTGYSSLSSLHRFPIGTLKIDRTFVNRMEFEEENSEIVKTIMTLGRNLQMSVVAEGVETQAQLDLLRDLGCDMGQGFLFSNAVDEESAEAWLQSVS